MTSSTEPLIILGSGPAGLTAALYAARANLNPLVIEGMQPGGQLTITSEVDNYPGFPEGIMGPELMEHFRKQAARFGTRFLQANVVKTELKPKNNILFLEDGSQLTAQTLIVSTGASAKWLGLESEKKFWGRGVSACATCDGFFFKNKDIAVIGGGDTAVEEATFLTRFAKKVYLIHRRDTLRASKIMQDRAFKNPKIEMVWDTGVEEITGDKAVNGIRLKNLKSGEVTTKELQGVFIAIGHEPNTKPFAGQLKTLENGYLWVEPGTTKTSVPGVFAAGDVADYSYRQAVSAAGTGCMAALDAERFLAH